VADSQSTLDMLQKDSGGLQRALQDAGLSADSNSLQFSLRDNGQQNSFAQNTNDQSNSNGSGRYAYKSQDNSEDATSIADETYYLAPGRVNLRV
jgi:flagellar hook-length control protein FliK